MIIPTPEFDPFFAPGAPLFRDRMLGYIEQQFSDLVTPGLLQRLVPSVTPEDMPDATPTMDESSRRVA